MNLTEIVARLDGQARTIHSLAVSVPPAQAVWRPDPESWSILEVINHLYDEEREDFRSHVNTLLHDPQGEWHPIDPQGWVTGRAYNQRELGASLEQFMLERQQSLTWLRGLASPDWEQGRQAPWGLLRAGDVMAAWAAHDLLHIRQLVELHWAYGQLQSQPYDARYAGDW